MNIESNFFIIYFSIKINKKINNRFSILNWINKYIKVNLKKYTFIEETEMAENECNKKFLMNLI